MDLDFDHFGDAGLIGVRLKCRGNIAVAEFNVHNISRVHLPDGSFDFDLNELNGLPIVELLSEHENVEMVHYTEADGHKLCKLEADKYTNKVDLIVIINLKIKLLMNANDFHNNNYKISYALCASFVPEAI